jgi:hypothetical protein
MRARRTAGLKVIRAYGNLNRFAFARSSSTIDNRIEAISVETVILLPLAINKSESSAFVENSLASRVSLGSGTILGSWILPLDARTA